MRSEQMLLTAISLLIGYLVYLILAPFIIPVFWAVVFAVIFHPFYEWLLKRVAGKRTIASLIACLAIALFLVIPLTVLGAVLANEFYTLYQWAEGYLKSAPPAPGHNTVAEYAERLLGRYMDPAMLDLKGMAAAIVKEASSFTAAGLKGVIKSFAELSINAALAFFSLFFLFRDGERLLDAVKGFIPIPEELKERIIARNRDVVTATIYGGVAVGAVQGILGGIGFWFLGVPSPLLWGFVMFIFSFIPGIGTAVVWLPASGYLFLTGGWIKAAALIGWSVLAVGMIDNILRPMIVSGRTNLHPLILFFSILGAVNVFGIIGIIAGPLIICIGLAALDLYKEAHPAKEAQKG